MKKLISALLVLVGIGIIFTPKIIGYQQKQEMNYEKQEYFQVQNTEEKSIIESMERYQEHLEKDSKFISSTTEQKETYEFQENILGYINIPKIGIEYAIKYGTSEDVLSKNIGLLENTHLPTGGLGKNTVLVGHRGYAGVHAFFRNVNELESGDVVNIINKKETLKYKVVSIDVVEPDDISLITLQENKDRLTLITCHPYMINNQRLVIICERDN